MPIPYGGTTARIALSPWLPYQVKRVLDRESFDIIHLHEPFIPMLCLSSLVESQTVNVGTFHACHEWSLGYWLGRPIMHRLGNKLHGKIAVSQPALDYISDTTCRRSTASSPTVWMPRTTSPRGPCVKNFATAN